MDYKKSNAPLSTTVHDLIDLAKPTGNIYETVCIIGKRANQISSEMKEDLEKKLKEFATMNEISRKSTRTESKSKFPSTTRSCPSPPSSPLRNMKRASWPSATWPRKKTLTTSKATIPCRAPWPAIKHEMASKNTFLLISWKFGAFRF